MPGAPAAAALRCAVGDQEYFTALEFFQRLLNVRRFGQKDLDSFLAQIAEHRTGNRRAGQRVKSDRRTILCQRIKIDFLGLAAFQIGDVQITNVRQSRLRTGGQSFQ